MGETRVNLLHLLEDIRDSYPFSPEETILTELIANSLDSKSSIIMFKIDLKERMLILVDNGSGMSEQNFVRYHDIASTTKIRGKGIGFAGVGAKLSLLYAEYVITETRSKSYCGATRWYLLDNYRAPWDT